MMLRGLFALGIGGASGIILQMIFRPSTLAYSAVLFAGCIMMAWVGYEGPKPDRAMNAERERQ